MARFDTRGICTAATITLVLAVAGGQPACSAEAGSTGPYDQSDIEPAIAPGAPSEHNPAADYGEPVRPKKRRGVTFDVPATTLDGVKLLGWKGPAVQQKSGFDMTVEFHGLGLQFEDERTYGYMRADRAFSGGDRVGVQFRFRF